MNSSNTELLVNKIGIYLPFLYPTFDIYQLSFIFFFALSSYILHATIAVTIIKSWKTSDYLKSPYFKVVVVGSFTDIIDNITFYIFFFTTELSVVAEYLNENANTVHLVVYITFYILSKWTYNMQNINYLFIAIIRFLSVCYPNSYYQYIDKHYPYFHVSLIAYSSILPLLNRPYCSLPYNFDYEKQMYFNGGKRGAFKCKYPFGYTRKEYYFIHVLMLHSTIVISIILTITILFKIKKLNKATDEFFVNTVKNGAKEKRMTRYIVLLGIVQLIRLIHDQCYYANIKINGYDESIRYINFGLRPFIRALWMFVNAVSIIFISKTLRDDVFKNLKLDIAYRKLFRGNAVTSISYNSNITQNINQGTKKKIII
uniref:Serpentine receptor class gamma n=1 Tax=Strongyloides venezuelensis TaxID=75913 RepID=A0A0K0F3A9_STRVS